MQESVVIRLSLNLFTLSDIHQFKMSISKLLKSASNSIDRLDAELLIAHTLKTTREFIITHPEKILTFTERLKFKSYVASRRLGLPIAYITKEKEFYGLVFSVNKHTLIPRPDTEILVEEVVQYVNQFISKENKQAVLIDIGTGSGCIPIAILHTLKTFGMDQEISSARATDISTQALKIAKKNAKRFNLKINFKKGNLLKPFLNKISAENLIITANLPYLTEEQFRKEKSIQHEPKLALVADSQGLALYQELFEQIKQIKNYQEIAIFIEIDPSQLKKSKLLIDQYFPKNRIETIQDLSGLDRVVKILLLNHDLKD